MNYRIYTKRHLKKNAFASWLERLSVTNLLIIINVVVFIIGIILLLIEININYIALQPNAFFQEKTIWTLVTSMFMHAPGAIIPFLSLHLFINMFVLFQLGNLSEKIIGKKRFLWFYLISGLFAGLLFVYLSYFFGNTELGARIFGSPIIPAVGASGAIFAIAGLFVMLTPRLRFMIIFFPFFSLPAYIMIPLLLFVTWIITSSTGFLIGNVAHFGGFLAGIIYGFYLRKKYPKKTRMISNYFSR